MKFIILTIVVVFAVQKSLGAPQPNLLTNIASSIGKTVSNVFSGNKPASTVASPTITTEVTVKATIVTPPGTTIDSVINSALDSAGKLITDSNTVLNNIIPGQTSTSPVKIVTNTIAQSSQVIENAIDDNLALIDNISQSLQNIANNNFTGGKGLLNDRINGFTQYISGISTRLQNTKLAPTIGLALTNVTNQGLATVAKVLASQTNLKPVTNGVDVLSKVAILNKLVDKITNLAGSALNQIPVPTATLTKIQTALAGSDIEDAIDNATAAGAQDLSNVVIPVTPAVNTTVNGIVSALTAGEQELNNVIGALNGLTPAIEVATGASFQEITNVLVQSTIGKGASTVISNIIGSVQNTSAGIMATLKLAFPTLASQLSGAADMVTNQLNPKSNNSLASNFLSCIQSESTTLQGVQAQYQTLITELNHELANGAIQASAVQNAILAAGDAAITVEEIPFRVEACESVQAAKTANVVLPAVSKLVSWVV